MPVTSSELTVFKSVSVSDASSNGGRLGLTQVLTNVKNSVFPDVPEAERVAGSTKYRKLFLKVSDPENLALQETKLFLTTPTEAGDRVYLFPGTQTDVQGSITGNERFYGAGQLAVNRSPGDTSMQVNVEDGAGLIFRDGDTVWVSNGTIEQKVVVATVTWNSNQATLTFESGYTLLGTYLAANTYVASIIAAGTVQASASALSIVGGTYNTAGYPVLLSNLGTIQDTWTITFTSASTFTVAGSYVGLVEAAGSTAVDLSPTNVNFAAPYFTLRAAGWGGSWVAGNTVVFTTTPAAYPFWVKRVVPSGCASFSLNTLALRIEGASA